MAILLISAVYSAFFITVGFAKESHRSALEINRMEEIRQFLKKLDASDDLNLREGRKITPSSESDNDWIVNSHKVVDISYGVNQKKFQNGTKTPWKNSMTVAHNKSTHAILTRLEARSFNFEDLTLWIGVCLGAVFSLTSVLVSVAVWALVRRYYRRKRCIDLSELSFCAMKDKNFKTPVYVSLSQLHNPRKPKASHYVVSVLDESNNFSIDSESDSTSTEEELFNATDYKSSDNSSFTEHYSGARVNLTSTPIKGSVISIGNSLPATPPRQGPRGREQLPISPLARTTSNSLN